MPASLTNNQSSVLRAFDVRSKMVVSISCAMVALFLSSVQSLSVLCTVTFIYALLMNRPKVLFVSYFFMGLMMALSILCVQGVALIFPNIGSENFALSKIMIPFLRGAAAMNAVLPLALTIKIQNLLTSLQNLHLPFIIYLPGAVMIRYIPSFINDIKQIFEALKIRGYKLSIKNIVMHPRLFLRLTFTPLVFLSLRTSEDLGIAAELKGVGYGKVTTYKKVKLQAKNYLLIVGVLLFVASCLVIEYQVGGSFTGGIHG